MKSDTEKSGRAGSAQVVKQQTDSSHLGGAVLYSHVTGTLSMDLPEILLASKISVSRSKQSLIHNHSIPLNNVSD
jgi:hypothetical protein